MPRGQKWRISCRACDSVNVLSILPHSRANRHYCPRRRCPWRFDLSGDAPQSRLRYRPWAAGLRGMRAFVSSSPPALKRPTGNEFFLERLHNIALGRALRLMGFHDAAEAGPEDRHFDERPARVLIRFFPSRSRRLRPWVLRIDANRCDVGFHVENSGSLAAGLLLQKLAGLGFAGSENAAWFTQALQYQRDGLCRYSRIQARRNLRKAAVVALQNLSHLYAPHRCGNLFQVGHERSMASWRQTVNTFLVSSGLNGWRSDK